MTSNDPGAPDPSRQVEIERSDEDRLAFRLTGRLDARTLGGVWQAVVPVVERQTAGEVLLDAREVAYCDGVGLGLFLEVQRLAALRSFDLQVTGLKPELERLLEKASLADPAAPQLSPPAKESVPEEVGSTACSICNDVFGLIAFVGELGVALVAALRHPRQIRFADLWVVAEKVGANALAVVMLLGWLIGLIIAFQTAAPMRQFGADIFTANIVAVAMVRELGPLMTAIILAGRSGSAFAAEIGTMKVTEELDALTTFGLEPVRFLVVPRVLAAMLMTPLLSGFATLMGLVGGYVVMRSLGYPLATYISRATMQVDYVDLLGGVFKAFVFALIVAAVGCQRGISTSSGPGAVGDSTTRAVVSGIVLIIVADGIIGVVFYALGI
jgi:phospholipid/cholesterol/gamma-HCH transport system permease protein